MNPTSPPSPQQRLQARRQRIATLRRRVTAGALATFALAFGTIAATGATGAGAAAAVSSTGAAVPAAATTTTSAPTPTPAPAPVAVAAVTTRQS